MIDRNQVKAELAMRIRSSLDGVIPVSGKLLDDALRLLEEDEKKLKKITEIIEEEMEEQK